MKNVLIIYAHPYDGSFNHAILETAQQTLKAKGMNVETVDLVKENFNPVISAEDLATHVGKGVVVQDVIAMQQKISASDLLLFIYPVWWGGMPAILKGYIDRVFTGGFAYGIEDGKIKGYLTSKKAVVLNTTGTALDALNANGISGAMNLLCEKVILNFCGIEVLKHLYFGAVPYVDDAARKKMLKDVQAALKDFK